MPRLAAPNGTSVRKNDFGWRAMLPIQRSQRGHGGPPSVSTVPSDASASEPALYRTTSMCVLSST